MSPSFDLYLAGVHFAIHSVATLHFEDADGAYSSFLIPPSSYASASRVDVRVETGAPPDLSGARRLFAAGDHWAMVEAAGCRWAVRADPRFNEPLWIARIDPDFRSVVIYGGAGLRQARDGGGLLSPLRYPLDQILAMYVLSRDGGAVVHAAGGSVHERGFVFPGRSGAGKSTLSRLLAKCRATRMFSDDRVVLRSPGGRLRVFGTPWPGDAGIASNASAPLHGVLFLRHGPENGVRALTAREGAERLLPVTSIPWYDPPIATRILEFCQEVSCRVPMYELSFTPGPGAADFLCDWARGATAEA